MTNYGIARCPCCGVELDIWYDDITGAILSIPPFNRIDSKEYTFIKDFMTNNNIYGIKNAIQASEEARLRMLLNAQNSILQQGVKDDNSGRDPLYTEDL